MLWRQRWSCAYSRTLRGLCKHGSGESAWDAEELQDARLALAVALSMTTIGEGAREHPMVAAQLCKTSAIADVRMGRKFSVVCFGGKPIFRLIFSIDQQLGATWIFSITGGTSRWM